MLHIEYWERELYKAHIEIWPDLVGGGIYWWDIVWKPAEWDIKSRPCQLAEKRQWGRGWLVVCRAGRWLRKLKIIGKYKNVCQKRTRQVTSRLENLGKLNFIPDYSEPSLLVSSDRLFIIWLLGWIPIRKDNKVGDEKQWKLSASFRTDSYPGLLTSQEGGAGWEETEN